MFSPHVQWHFVCLLLFCTFFLYTLSRGGYPGGTLSRPPHVLNGIFAPETVDALYNDANLHDTIIKLADTLASTSVKYGESYKSEGLEGFGHDLAKEVARMKGVRGLKQRSKFMSQNRYRNRRRGLLDDLGNLFKGNLSAIGGGNNGDAGNDQGGILSGLGDLFQQGLSNITGSLVDGLAMPAFFLGIGVGLGTEDGLNLTTPENSKAIASRVVASSGEQPTGLNLVAQNLGSGLSGQLVPALSSGASTDLPIGMIAFALAQGIGQGSASGFKLTQAQFAPTNGSDIMTIAKNLGLGITEPIASSIDIQKLFNQGTGSAIAQLPQIASAAGRGLGQGASKGLGLTKSGGNTGVARRQAPADPSQMDIAGIFGNLTQGLSESFLESANLSSILGGLPNIGSGFSLDNGTLVSIASGAGKGIGEGVAIGLTGQDKTNKTSNGGQKTEELIAKEFTKNLVASLIQSGGLAAALDDLTSQAGDLTKSIDTRKVVEGVARGLVEGGVSALSEAGGLEKVIKAEFPLELAMNLPPLPPSTFDDSLNGSAVAFTRGLSGEGVLLIALLLNNKLNNSTTASQVRSMTRRGIRGGLSHESGVATHKYLGRQTETIIPAIDGQTLQGVAQAGVDFLHCSGVGGLAGVALAIMGGPSLKSIPKLDNSTLAALPKDPVTIKSEGNSFTVTASDMSVSINGIGIARFAVLTILHILFTTLSFFIILPIYLALGAIWRFSDMIGHPIKESKIKMWRMITLVLFTPLAFVGIILGIAGMGSAAHFHSGHGVFGLLTLLILLPSVLVSVMRLRTTAPIPPPQAFLIKNQFKAFSGAYKIHIIANTLIQATQSLGMAAWFAGFTDLRAISLCVVDAVFTSDVIMNFANAMLLLQISATALLALRFFLERRIAIMQKDEDHVPILSANDETKPVMSAAENSQDGPWPLQERNTAESIGKADSQVGWLDSSRKLGEGDSIRVSLANPRPLVVSPGTYDVKLSSFADDVISPASPQRARPRRSRAQGHYRASSEVVPLRGFDGDVGNRESRGTEVGQVVSGTPQLQAYEKFTWKSETGIMSDEEFMDRIGMRRSRS